MSHLESQSQDNANSDHSYSPAENSKRQPQMRQKKSRKAARRHAYNDQIIESENEEDSGQVPDESANVSYYKGGKVIKVLAQRIKEGSEQFEYLCRFQNKSFLHLEWLTLNAIKQKDILMPRVTKRLREQMQERLKEVQKKFGNQHYFNPSFVKIDRILSSAVMFPLMHQKKGNQIAGKWCQSLMLVCSKLLNFEQDNFPFGVEHKLQIQQEDKKIHKIKDQVILEHIINRIYLDRFEKSSQPWSQIGKSFSNFSKIHKDTPQEISGQIIKQCAIFLYWQWHSLCIQRYVSLASELKINIKKNLKEKVPVNFCMGDEELNLNQFVEKNIFMNEKKGETPTNKDELQVLNPGQFSYKWLFHQEKSQEQYCSYNFKHLKIQDLRKLSLNVQVDPLYLIKWSQLEYDDISWEKQSNLKCPQKINEFKSYNKLPNKKIRESFENNRNCQKLLNHGLNKDKRVTYDEIQKCKRKLYCYHQNRQIKQYAEENKPIYKNYKVLKSFQLESLNWMIKCWHERRNCILADQMGLGKTIQTIAFLHHLYSFEDVIGPFLIVAPVSTLSQWRNEIEQWSDFNCILYKGKSSCRNLIQEYEFHHNFVTNDGVMIKYQKLPRFQIFLTNYEIFTSDIEIIRKIAFQHIIIDEAHKMKNINSKISQTLRRLPCTRYLLLTGTPIQNNTLQFWSLLNLIEPKKFASQEQFKKEFGQLKSIQDLQKFKELLKPYMLRRVKSDVEKSIPKLSEMVVDLDLTTIQKTYYKGIMEQNKSKFVNGLKSVNLNNVAICLRECCNHPFMLSEQIEEEIYSERESNEERMEMFIKCSSKMLFVHKMLEKCKESKSKTLIFTQFLQMLSILQEYCQYQDIKFQKLSGSVSYIERQNSIDRFNKDPEVLVFLISTKAGGTGINLTSASNIIIYDSDWNPQNDIQAIARAHRIGQKKNVTVYRLITSNTYESILYESAVKKLGIGLALFENEYFTSTDQITKNQKSSKSIDELQKLMKNGYLAFSNSEKQKQKINIENVSIEQILKQNTRPIQYVSKQFQLSKAKIISNQASISIDDPNFWEVALKNVQSPLQKLVKHLKIDSKNSLSLQEQEKLIIQTNEIFYKFIKEKITMTNYNAQDEKELKEFLEKIACSRDFHRKFRKIVNDWLEQIEKPSRRFTKLQIQQIKLKPSRNNKMESRQSKQGQQKTEKKETREVRAKKEKQKDKEKEKDQEKEKEKDKEKEKEKEEKEKKEEKEEKKEEKKQQESKKEQKVNKMQEEDQLIYLQGFCSFCERKRCSIYCKGLCKRMFHRACYQKYKNQQELMPPKSEIEQIEQSSEELTRKLQEEFRCIECKEGKAKCFICNKVSEAVAYQKQKPQRSKKKGTENQNEKTIQQIVQNSSEEDRKKVYECKQNQCNRFYHLQCLLQVKENLAFQVNKKQKQGYQIKCPSHFCAQCKDKLSVVMTCSCLRCPVSYHKKKCRPSVEDSILRLTNELFICNYHLGEEQLNLKKEQLVVQEEQSRKQKKEQKKRNKLSKNNVEMKEIQSETHTKKEQSRESEEKKKIEDESQGQKARKRVKTGKGQIQ